MKPEEIEIVDTAKKYAIQCHEKTNHLYDNKPYELHLNMVFYYADKYSYLLKRDEYVIAIASAFAHDVIEDTRETYNDVKKVLGETIADVVYALTNEKGKTRDERANENYYKGIRNCDIATYVKICDRLANVTYSSQNKQSGMFKKYKKEHPEFCEKIFKHRFLKMIVDLDSKMKE